MNYAQMLALLAGLSTPTADHAGFPQLQSGGFDAAVPVTIRACPQPIGTQEIEGQTIICGTVSVPEDHAAPDGKRIDLLFTVLKSHSSYPEPDPVVYLHGGPGSGTMGSLSVVAEFFDKFRTTRDVVMFDQRAAGLSSSSVTCFDALNLNFVDVALKGEAIKEEESEDGLKPSPVMTQCVKELKSTGIDLSKYNTYQNALDVRAIMSTLGYGSYNIYGISYGTKLTLEVMRSAPEGLRSVIIDGVAPPSVHLYDTLAQPINEAVVAVVQQCAADPACNEAYPDLGAVIARVFKKAVSGELKADGEAVPPEVPLVIMAFRNRPGSYLNASLTPYIPAFFYELDRGEKIPTVDMLVEAEFQLKKPGEDEVMAAAEDLTDTQKKLVNSALSDISINLTAQQNLGDLIGQLREAVAANTIAGPVAGLFEQELTRAALSYVGEDRQKAADILVAYASLQSKTPTKETLLSFVSSYFTGPDLARLNALIQAMSPQEVVASFKMIQDGAYKYQAEFIGEVDLYVYSCQEDIPYNTLAGYKAHTANLDFPELGLIFDESAAKFYANCTAFEQHPRPGFHDPVVSDIPTLSIGSSWDTQTAASWAEEATKTLTNAQHVLIPEAGHGALIFQPCVADMGVAFINAPGRKLDDRCAQASMPEFYIAPWVNEAKAEAASQSEKLEETEQN